MSAQGVVSAALGADSSAYRAKGAGAGVAAQNPAQGLRMAFAPSGLKIASGKTEVGLSLRAIGYGASLRAVASVRPTAKANRVTYTHAGLSEWYANGPLGLEQGFTIPRTPSHGSPGPLTLALALSGDTQASLAAGGQSITLSRAGGPHLRYTGLMATDARGDPLHTWLELHAGRLLLRIDARGARYPVRIDPFIQQGKKLTANDEASEGFFGWSVALSSDGNTALIGGMNDADDAGAAWVFTRSGSTWKQQGAKLTGGGEVGAGLFGSGVALSADGNTALIGGRYDGCTTPLANSCEAIGAAWVFTRSGSTWTQQGPKLRGSDEIDPGEFGASVALSSDGNTALIGGFGDSHGAPESFPGSAWVFTRSGSTWTQQGPKLTGSEESPSAAFGWSVALSSDGNTALVGGSGESATVVSEAEVTEKSSVVKGLASTTGLVEGARVTGAKIKEPTYVHKVTGEHEVELTREVEGAGSATITEKLTFFTTPKVGAAWVFTRAGSTWTQQGEKLTGGGETNFGPAEGGYFGYSVALSADGNTALIGAPADNVGVGAAWVFTRAGSTWTQQSSMLTGTGGEPTRFGLSVALSAVGNTALIGGPFSDNYRGAAWVFTRAGSTWTQQGEKLTGAGETTGFGEGTFGYAVALSADDSTALISGVYDTHLVGAVWVFVNEATTPPSNTSPPVISGIAQIGQSLSCSSGSWTGNPPPTFTYQWLRDGAKITSANANSYIVQKADAGHDLACEVTASNGAGKASANSAAVKVPAESTPSNTSLPAISGTAQVGQTLSCSTGSWTGNPPPTFTYQWLRDGSGIGGATGSGYVAQAADQGHTLTCEVTASNSAGLQAATSAGVAIPAPPPPPPPPQPPPAPPASPHPVIGQSQIVNVIAGTVTVRLKGTATFAPLSGSISIPDGSEVDATNGRVIITAVTPNGQTVKAEVYEGRFLVHQDRTPPGETHLILSLPLTGCPRVPLPRVPGRITAAGARHRSGPRSRHLWVSESGGSWGTTGRYVSTSVEGTRWLTIDECNQSQVNVAAGKVVVDDFVRKRTKTVKAGQRYVAVRRGARRA